MVIDYLELYGILCKKVLGKRATQKEVKQHKKLTQWFNVHYPEDTIFFDEN